LTLVSGLKWVDEVIPNAPYEITEEFMNTLFNKYSIDYIIHGDDPCLLPDGTDAYALAKKVGRYKQIKRTEGVSSTDIVGKVQMFSSLTVVLDHTYPGEYDVYSLAYNLLLGKAFQACPK
jgi:glycerol-3-phosphate cytidylyltransferase-like family protein